MISFRPTPRISTEPADIYLFVPITNKPKAIGRLADIVTKSASEQEIQTGIWSRLPMWVQEEGSWAHERMLCEFVLVWLRFQLKEQLAQTYRRFRGPEAEVQHFAKSQLGWLRQQPGLSRAAILQGHECGSVHHRKRVADVPRGFSACQVQLWLGRAVFINSINGLLWLH